MSNGVIHALESGEYPILPELVVEGTFVFTYKKIMKFNGCQKFGKIYGTEKIWMLVRGSLSKFS